MSTKRVNNSNKSTFSELQSQHPGCFEQTGCSVALGTATVTLCGSLKCRRPAPIMNIFLVSGKHYTSKRHLFRRKFK